MFNLIPGLDDPAAVGREMHALVSELFPLNRSLTGEGLRETLRKISAGRPLEIRSLPTGTPILDWTVPKEWNLNGAWIKDPSGQVVVDAKRSNLHVVGYSMPVRARMPLAELKKHLHTLPDHPDWIPYRTSYYKETWGFCLTHRLLESLSDGEYEVCIESTLADGVLNWGEAVLPGETTDEVLISAHVCHPSLANDNLSGIAAAVFLARRLAGVRRKYTYRFLFAPGTIGGLAWLAQNEKTAGRVKHGLVLACLGDAGDPTYKRSEAGNAPVDRVVALALRDRDKPFRVVDFTPYGYDERQYNSPGFRLPVGCLMRSMYGTFPEYHTSADNLDFVRPEALADSLDLLLSIVNILENDAVGVNKNPRGEPQLGRRGLYDHLGGRNEAAQAQLALLWVLNQSDGRRSLLDIAERSGLPFQAILAAAAELAKGDLLEIRA